MELLDNKENINLFLRQILHFTSKSPSFGLWGIYIYGSDMTLMWRLPWHLGQVLTF
jgi:hypothetical protein